MVAGVITVEFRTVLLSPPLSPEFSPGAYSWSANGAELLADMGSMQFECAHLMDKLALN